MNILVYLRLARDPASFTVNRKAQKIFVNRERFIVNPSDRNALEAALALAGADDRVTVAALGGQPTREALQMARAMGANHAVCIDGQSDLDALGLTRACHALVGYLGSVDLVLLGAEVIDADTAQVCPRLAAALAWQFVDSAYQVTVRPDGLACVVPEASGYRWRGVDLPAVVTVARDCNQPRYAPAAQIINMFTNPEAVTSLTLEDLGLDLASLAPVTVQRGESFPPERSLGRRLDGDEALRQIVAAVQAR